MPKSLKKQKAREEREGFEPSVRAPATSRKITGHDPTPEHPHSTSCQPLATLIVADVPACTRCGKVGHVAQRDSVDPDLPAGNNCRIAIGQQAGPLSPPAPRPGTPNVEASRPEAQGGSGAQPPPTTRDVARVLSTSGASYRVRAALATFIDRADRGQLAEVAHYMRVELEREGRDKRTGEVVRT